MTGVGYVTTRKSLEGMLDSLINSPNSTPDARFVDSIHNTMKNNLWHQNPDYYTRILRVYRQVLIGLKEGKVTSDELNVMTKRIDALWGEAVELFSPPGTKGSTTSITIDLLAIRTHCYVAVNNKLRTMTSSSGATFLSSSDRYLSKAKKAYAELLEASRTVTEDMHLKGEGEEGVRGDLKNSNNIVSQLTVEMQTILKAADEHGISHIAASRAKKNTLDLLVSPADNVNRDQQVFLADSLDKYFARHLEGSGGVASTSSTSRGGADPFTMPSEYLHSTHLVRLGFSQLPIELAKQGKIDDALSVFEDYLKTKSASQTIDSIVENLNIKAALGYGKL
eukprot:gene36008-44409_t